MKKHFSSPQIAWYYAVAGLSGAGTYIVTNKVPISIIVAAIIIIVFKIRKK